MCVLTCTDSSGCISPLDFIFASPCLMVLKTDPGTCFWTPSVLHFVKITTVTPPFCRDWHTPIVIKCGITEHKGFIENLPRPMGILKLKQTFIEQSQLFKTCFKSRFKKGMVRFWDTPHSDVVKSDLPFCQAKLRCWENNQQCQSFHCYTLWVRKSSHIRLQTCKENRFRFVIRCSN